VSGYKLDRGLDSAFARRLQPTCSLQPPHGVDYTACIRYGFGPPKPWLRPGGRPETDRAGYACPCGSVRAAAPESLASEEKAGGPRLGLRASPQHHRAAPPGRRWRHTWAD